MKTVITLLLLLSCNVGFSANHYIRAGASGSNNGSSWANAWTALSSVTWTRGDTYYLAGGAYTAGNISSGTSGGQWIIIKKANAADNGADAGWDDSYASTQAVFTGITTLSGNLFEIDGVTGSGESGHGIKFDAGGTSFGGLRLSGSESGGYKLYHLEMMNGAYNAFDGGNALHDGVAVKKGVHVAYCWLHDASNNGASFNNCIGTSYADYGLLFEHNYVTETGGAGNGTHGQAIKFERDSAYAIIRNNVFRNNSGTGSLVWLDTAGDVHDNYRIYNNVFLLTDPATFPLSSPCVIYGKAGPEQNNFYVANNTIWGFGDDVIYDEASGAVKFLNPGGTNVLVNNLFENSRFATGGHDGLDTDSNNGYYNNTGVGVPNGSTNQVDGTASAFTNPGSDFTLASDSYAIGAGLDQSSVFTTDFAGNTRASWDLGAYAYDGAPPEPPAPTTRPSGNSSRYPRGNHFRR